MEHRLDWKPDIFTYLSYREYLGDYYDAAKANTRAFSYRYFSRKAGYSSPNFLKLVIDGRRNLSSDSVEKFASALKLDRDEARFFSNLVTLEQAEKDADRNEAYERVAASRTYRGARRIDHGFFDYLSRWYNPVIREMVMRPDFVEDPAWIASRLVPAIRPAQAEKALALLLDLGLLIRDDEGTLMQGDAAITTGHEVRSLALGNYHRQMLERAGESIELVERDRRDLYALTIVVSDDTVAELKSRIHAFGERVLDLSMRDPNPQNVYQLGIQLFPLTRSDHDEDA
ncbi:MAG: hypothetical protein ACJAYU_000504 [Bradymonadia bacterium]|jgi:uncharacterized protein (TIGR02147 family)